MNDSKCLSNYELAAFCNGRLPDDALGLVAEHLGNCESCEIRYVSIESSQGSQFKHWFDGPSDGPSDDSLSLRVHDDEAELSNLLRRAKQLQPAGDETLLVPAPFSVPAKLGQVRLLRRLEQGGMGAVYQGRDEGLDCLVAVKVLRPDLVQRADLIERFDREMKVIGQLNHTNLVRARTAGRQDGLQYIVMDYIPGIDLSRLVRLTGPLDVPDACAVICQTARGLEHLAKLHLVHRDIKPKNLMLTEDGEVKILDLGLARLRYGDADEALTGSHVVVGTFDYVAPEQTRHSDSDIRADIYSLGCTLFKLLAGHAPFAGSKYSSNHAKLLAHCTAPLPDITQERKDLPPDLVDVLQHMLAKRPEDRVQTAAQVEERLAPFAQHADLPKLAAMADTLRGQETAAVDAAVDEGIEAIDTSQSLDTQREPEPSPVMVEPATQQRQAFRGWWVGLALVAVLGFAVGITWLAVNNSGRETWDPNQLDQDAVPLRWYNLLEHEPVRVWPAGWETARVRYDPELEDVMVEEPDIVLLQQGTTQSSDYRLQVEISKSAMTGSAGIFWGFGKHPKLQQEQFQAVFVRCYHDRNGELVTELLREFVVLKEGFPNIRPMFDGESIALEPVVFTGKGVLDLEIRRGVLQRVRWQGIEHKGLIKIGQPGTDMNTGKFGIAGRHGATLFRDARFQLLREREK